jgi:hypothetical protein
MTTTMHDDLAQLGTATDRLCSALSDGAATALDSATVLQLVSQLELIRRKLETTDYDLIPELNRRAIPETYSTRSVRDFLVQYLRLSPREATARVTAADLLGPRIAVTGQPLPATLTATSLARRAGQITTEHANVILDSMHKLPHSLPAQTIEQAEAFLAEHAHRFDPRTLRGIARQQRDTIDPDGAEPDEHEHTRRRRLTCGDTGDGMGFINGDLDTETTALAQTVLHSLAAPRPTDATGPDTRTAGQRLHDAFRELLKLGLRAGDLPRSGGVPASVIITMTAEQFETGTGLAHTSFGQRLHVTQALRLADEASIAWLVHNSQGGILNYGHKQRIATQKQTLALIARDGGCTFPGCDKPPEWTERHHVIPWTVSQRTRLDELCLSCDYHHDRHLKQGWTITIRDGVPWYTPPAWLDPEQKPIRHHRYDLKPPQ